MTTAATIEILDHPLIKDYDAATLYRVATQTEDYALRMDGVNENVMWNTVARLRPVRHTDYETGEVTETMAEDPERTYTVESRLAMLPDGGVVFVPFRCTCEDNEMRYSTVLPPKPTGRLAHKLCKHAGMTAMIVTKALIPADVFDASEAYDEFTKKGRRRKQN